MGQHVVHRVVGRLDPGDLRVAAARSRLALQRPAQALLAQPQPGRRAPTRTRRTGSKTAAMTPVTASSGCKQDLPVGLAPDQPDRQRRGAARRGRPCCGSRRRSRARSTCSSASDMVPFMPSSSRSLNNAGMVDAVGVGDQRVGHPGQVQQPVPVGVVAGQPGDLQRQHDPDLPERDLRRPARRTRTAPAVADPETPRSSSIDPDRRRAASPAPRRG